MHRGYHPPVSQQRLPLFAFGNIAVGVIAIGNVAYGVVAIGFSVSVGVVAIGMNAVGALAIGLNSLGPVSIGAVNGIGSLAWAGVNSIGGHGSGLVNTLASPMVGVVLGVVAFVIASKIGTARTPRETGPQLATVLAGAKDDFAAEAKLVRDGDGLALVDGDTRIAVTGEAALVGKRVNAQVRIIEEFDDTGAYREAPDKHRRYLLESATAVERTPFFATRADLDWTFARAMQLSAVCALAVLTASYFAAR
jgi:hypothetical protein